MMKTATATMFVLFWVFYEVSGGAEFTPRERVVVSQAPWVLREQEERRIAQAQVAQSAAVADVVSTPLAPVATAPQVQQVSFTFENAEQVTPAAVLTQDVAAVAPRIATPRAPAPVATLPETFLVSGSRVNLRAGPGTGHAVVDTLLQGTQVERLSVTDAGWMEIRLTAGGTIGWMSADYLIKE